MLLYVYLILLQTFNFKVGWCYEYLVIPNFQKFCKGSKILSASEGRDEVSARRACDNLEHCGLITASFGTSGKNDYHFSWLCEDDFTNLELSPGWTTLVKSNILERLSNGLNLLLNATTQCEVDKDVPIHEMSTLDKITKDCIKDSDCFLLISNTRNITKCKGHMTKPVPSPGNFILYKNPPSENPIKNTMSYSKTHFTNSIRGPLTPDNYYNNLQKGTLVRVHREQ